MFLCYQFLLDRTKEEDFNGNFGRAILETLSLMSIKEEIFEKTHLIKVVPRFINKGDAKTQFYAKRVVANLSTAKDGKNIASVAKAPVKKEGEARSPVGTKAEARSVAGMKRAASTAAEGGVQKKAATAASKLNGTTTASKAGTIPKKAVTEAGKPVAAPAAPVKAKQVTAKPSGLFASLQSAAKKPGTSNASRAATSTGAGDRSSASTAQSAAPKSSTLR